MHQVPKQVYLGGEWKSTWGGGSSTADHKKGLLLGLVWLEVSHCMCLVPSLLGCSCNWVGQD